MKYWLVATALFFVNSGFAANVSELITDSGEQKSTNPNSGLDG